MENSSSTTYTISDSYKGESSYVSEVIMNQNQATALINMNRQQEQQPMSGDNDTEGPSLYYPSSPQQQHQHQQQQQHQHQQQQHQQQQSGHGISSSSHHHAIVTIPEGSTISSTSSSIVSITDKRPTQTATLTPSTIENIPSTLSSTENNNSVTPIIIMSGDLSSASSSSNELYQYRQHHTKTNPTAATTTTSSTNTLNNTVEYDDSVATTMSYRQIQQQRPGSGSVSSTGGSGRYNPSNYPVALKILVSNNVAGSIIGRAGQTISDFQNQSNARIKLSQSGEYFPNTQDRVCLIQGDINTIKIAIGLLLERIYIIQEHQYTTQMTWQQQQQLSQYQQRQTTTTTTKDHHNHHYYNEHNNQNQQHHMRSLASSSLSVVGGTIEPSIVSSSIATTSTVLFDFIVRLLVPTTSCGKLIGKSGSNIKLMEETTGVYSIRLSPKENHHNHNIDQQQHNTGSTTVSKTNMNNIIMALERIVTITGPSLQCCIQCVNMIVDGMILNPETSRYNNMTTCYSQYQHNMSNNPLMTHQQQHQQHHVPSMAFTAGGGSMMIPQQQQQQQLLVPTSIQSNPSSIQRHYYEGGGIVGPVGTRTSSNNQNSGLTRRIASSPDLPVHRKQQLHNNQCHHLHDSGVNLRYASTEQHQQSGTPSSASDADRLNVTNIESSYVGNTNVRHYSSSSLHQQTTSPNSPVRTINNSIGSVYFVPQEQQHVHQSHQDHAAGVVDPIKHVFHHDDISSSSSLLRQNPLTHPQREEGFVAHHSVSAPNLLDMHADYSTSLRISNSNSSSGTSVPGGGGGGGMTNSIDYHPQSSATTIPNLVPQTPTMIGSGCFTAQLLLPDSMIGSILGRGGRTLNELQMISGTRIRISQRGDYVPNTPRDIRIVTIRGPTSQAVWQAQYVISQRIVLPSTAVSTSAPITSIAAPYIQTSNSISSRRGSGGAGVNSGRNEISYRPIGQQQHNINEQQQQQSISHTSDRIDKVKDIRTIVATTSVATATTAVSSKNHE